MDLDDAETRRSQSRTQLLVNICLTRLTVRRRERHYCQCNFLSHGITSARVDKHFVLAFCRLVGRSSHLKPRTSQERALSSKTLVGSFSVAWPDHSLGLVPGVVWCGDEVYAKLEPLCASLHIFALAAHPLLQQRCTEGVVNLFFGPPPFPLSLFSALGAARRRLAFARFHNSVKAPGTKRGQNNKLPKLNDGVVEEKNSRLSVRIFVDGG